MSLSRSLSVNVKEPQIAAYMKRTRNASIEIIIAFAFALCEGHLQNVSSLNAPS